MWMEAGELHLQVTNDGLVMESKNNPQVEGIGLRNLHRLLHLLQGRFTSGPSAPGQWKAHLQLPLSMIARQAATPPAPLER
jgi:signal transduction histidine kinase